MYICIHIGLNLKKKNEITWLMTKSLKFAGHQLNKKSKNPYDFFSAMALATAISTTTSVQHGSAD